MSAPEISASSSILGFRRNETFNFQPAATNLPVIWEAIGLPPGVTVDTHSEKLVTGAESTDVLTSAGHGFSDGDRVYFPTLTGGSGLTTGTIYYVRDKATDTFKVAATMGGAAVGFSTDVSAGTVRKVSSGLISGSCPTAGVYVVTLSATNAAAETGTREFVIGIDSEIAPGAGNTSDSSLDWTIEQLTRAVAVPSPVSSALPPTTRPDVLATWKEDDVIMLALRFTKGGVPVDPDPTTLKLVIKELEPERILVEASDFEKVGSGAAAYFNLPVELSGPGLAAALSDYENDGGTGFDALVEIEWTASVTHKASPLTLKSSTLTFRVRIERDIAEG